MRLIFYCLMMMAFASISVHDRPLARLSVHQCPNIRVSCPDDASTAPVKFTVEVTGADPNAKLTYNWRVSAGTITNGQATNTIIVDRTGLGGQPVTATVEIGGLESNCGRTASCSTSIIEPSIAPRKFDEYSILALKDERMRLDKFATQLISEPGSQGYIISYAGRRVRLSEADARAGRAKNYLIQQYEINPERIVKVGGGYREDWTIELWIVPTGATPPSPTPTLSPKEVKKIKDSPKRRVPLLHHR